ncbi:MAG: Na+/H+ antiporter [Chitinophagales bacterium]
MSNQIIVFVLLLFGVSLLSVVADKIRVSYPIMLVIAGLVIWLIPGMPTIKLDPDVVFLIFLPPLLYSAAWSTSWNDFLAAKRPIGMLAFVLVIATSTIVAFFSVWLIPGFTLALGFLLGGIISPPDAVAATSVLKTLKIPRRVATLLEGESLVNDASSLIVFRFAIVAILSGQFSLIEATGQFFLVAIMGVVVGLVVANVVYAIHRFLPTTPSVDTALTLISPYLCYLIAEHFHFSGVLAVVAAGLFLSFRAADIFSYESRLQAIGVWSTLTFILTGVVFILIGLQLPQIIGNLDGTTLGQAIEYGIIISLLIIVVRLAWVYPGAFLPRIIVPSIRKGEPNPGWKSVFIVGWSGMRGVVSLASALAIPLTLQDGTAFPFRNLILFITFLVILITLVFQGISLPLIIRFLKIPSTEDETKEEKDLRIRLAYSSIEKIEASYSAKDATSDALHHIKTKYERRIDHIHQRMLTADNSGHSTEVFHEFNKLQLQLVHFERNQLTQLRRAKKFGEEVLRKLEYELDLEEAVLRRQAQVKKEDEPAPHLKSEAPLFKL